MKTFPQHVLILLAFYILTIVAASILYPFFNELGAHAGLFIGFVPFIVFIPANIVFVITLMLHFIMKKWFSDSREKLILFVVWIAMLLITTQVNLTDFYDVILK